jgi:hypothetical protein
VTRSTRGARAGTLGGVITAADRALLDRPLHGLLTVPPGGRRLPAPRPVWFEATDEGTLQLFSMAGALKLRRLAADPRASFVVVTPADEPEAWVSVEADVTVHDDGASTLAHRLAARYWDDLDSPEHRALLAAYEVEEDLRRIVLHPTRVTRGPA